MRTVSTLSKTVCLNSPAAYFASVRANELSRIFFPMPSLVSTIFLRICLNLLNKSKHVRLDAAGPCSRDNLLSCKTGQVRCWRLA